MNLLLDCWRGMLVTNYGGCDEDLSLVFKFLFLILRFCSNWSTFLQPGAAGSAGVIEETSSSGENVLLMPAVLWATDRGQHLFVHHSP